MLHRCFPEIEANTTFSLVFPLNAHLSQRIHSFAKEVPCGRLFTSLRRHERPTYDFSGVPYPNNLLRNVARNAARSDFMLLLDIDILPSRGLRHKFLDYIKENPSSLGRRGFQTERDKTLWVVPAYEIVEQAAIPEDKSSLLQLRKSGLARPFYQELCWKCQVRRQS